MKFGYYSDKELPKSVALDRKPIVDYKTNSHGYRCPEFNVPDGKKNIVVLGCSHTFGEGLEDNAHWVHFISQHNTKRLRWWNLGQPGASADKVVRILYGCENVLFPKIIIVCWPYWSRRERLHAYPQSLISTDPLLKNENNETDKHNFLKNVFFVEKFAEKIQAKIFHCFSQEVYNIPEIVADGNWGNNVFSDTTIKHCWPVWDKHLGEGAQRERITRISLAKDSMHYGVEHHKRFAELFLGKFGGKLR